MAKVYDFHISKTVVFSASVLISCRLRCISVNEVLSGSISFVVQMSDILQMSQRTTKPTIRHVRPTKSHISQRIRAL